MVDEHGARLDVRGRVLSRFVRPLATSVCINSTFEFTVDGRTVYGEDQDVWPIRDPAGTPVAHGLAVGRNFPKPGTTKIVYI